DDDQRGLAHLLEHMAFNGSANFPAGTLLKRFEAAGLTFGAHQNATTSFLDTVYKLTIPNDPKVVDLSLLYFADVAYRLTLDPDEITREVRVVEAERRARDNAAARAFNRQLAVLTPGSRFADRVPIGDARVVRGATAEQLRAYYRKWYRPDNAVLLVAGNVDVEQLDALVRKHFSAWPSVDNPPANHSSGIRSYESDRADVVNEYGLISSDINIAWLESPRDFSSVGGYRQWLVHKLGKEIINRRLREQILEGQVPFVSAWAAADTSFGKTLIESHAKGAPEDWEAILKTLLTELKRARDFGFGDAEFIHAREVMLADLEKESLDEAEAAAPHWISLMDAALDEGRRPFGARQAYELSRRLAATITRAEVEEAARALCARAPHHLAFAAAPRGAEGADRGATPRRRARGRIGSRRQAPRAAVAAGVAGRRSDAGQNRAAHVERRARRALRDARERRALAYPPDAAAQGSRDRAHHARRRAGQRNRAQRRHHGSGGAPLQGSRHGHALGRRHSPS